MGDKLYLGNRVYSSWSLRGWLLFAPFGLDADVEIVPLHTDAFEDYRKRVFPARQVPTLVVETAIGPQPIWDSLSIAEFLNERHPDAGLWPADTGARAAARSLCAEMHSGFRALRITMPMNLRRRYTTFQPDQDTAADIARICALWRWARENWGEDGPYLFGEKFTAADAFFAPVAARFETYATALDAPSKAYSDALLSHPATVSFYCDAEAETWTLPHNEMDID